VRLEFELDSEIYPELHAALSSMRSAGARAERVRQLAAAGLVWEKVRLHGVAAGKPVMEEQPLLAAPADAASALPEMEAAPLPLIERRVAPAERPPPALAPRRRAGDFVDLAINVEPTPGPASPPEPRATPPSRRDVEQAIRELPVLMDVVTDVRTMSLNVVPDVSPVDEPVEQLQAPDLSEPALWASADASPGDMPALPDEPAANEHVDDDAEEQPEVAPHVTALAHKPATRSRLMRMKERGLFKNG